MMEPSENHFSLSRETPIEIDKEDIYERKRTFTKLNTFLDYIKIAKTQFLPESITIDLRDY